MGQRANLVIVRQQDWRLYYDHWCAKRKIAAEYEVSKINPWTDVNRSSA